MIPFYLLIIAPFLGLIAENASTDVRPNIIYIIADDIGWSDFGCYGNPAVKTPHIDAIAEKGMIFQNAFLTTSSCSPSRISIITGRYPHNTGAAELHSPIPNNQIPFPSLLKKEGFYTVQAGKAHFGPNAENAFDQFYEGADSGPGGEERWVKCITERPKEKPFFAWFASYDAHRAWQEDPEAEPHDPKQVIVPPYLADLPGTKADLAAYYDEIARFDRYVGKVYQSLESEGVLDNTVLIIMSDNGMPFPRAKTRMYDSGIKTPLIIHWPNGIKRPGSVSHSLISAVDIAPTILEIAGVAVPETVQGKSFSALFENPNQSFRKYVYAEHNWHDYEAYERMVRSKDFLYVYNGRPNIANGGPADSKRSPSQADLEHLREVGKLSSAQADIFIVPRPHEELFAVHDDLYQLLNLAAVNRYQTVLAEYRHELRFWQQVTKDDKPEQLTPSGFDDQGNWLPGIDFNNIPRGTMPGDSSSAIEAKGRPGF